MKYLKQISSGQQYLINSFICDSQWSWWFLSFIVFLWSWSLKLRGMCCQGKEKSENSKLRKLLGINMETCCFSVSNFNITHNIYCKDLHPYILSASFSPTSSILMPLAFLGSINFKRHYKDSGSVYCMVCENSSRTTLMSYAFLDHRHH